jgi:hypothetical protein
LSHDPAAAGNPIRRDRTLHRPQAGTRDAVTSLKQI